MKIGIDLIGINPLYSGGVSTFSIGLTKGLARTLKQPDSITIFVTENNEDYLKSIFRDIDVKFKKIRTWRGRGWVIKYLLLISWIIQNFKIIHYFDKYCRSFGSLEMESEVDLIIVPTTTLTYFDLKIPTILCPHDIQQEYYPEFFTKKELIYRWAAYRLSCWAATSIQVSSIFIKNCILEKYNFISEKKIFIAHEGVDLEIFNSDNKIDKTNLAELISNEFFIFYPAQIWPHKNHLLLLESLAKFRDKNGFEILCVLTGQDFGFYQILQNKIIELKLKKVIYLGKVDFDSVIWLYRNCEVVLALGLHESSSLPLREGAVFGKPLICTNILPNKEVQEFINLNLVDCFDSNELSDELCKVFNKNEKIIKDGKINMKLINYFSWNEIAKIYINKINIMLDSKLHQNKKDVI